MKKWLHVLLLTMVSNAMAAQGESNAITYGQLSNEFNTSNALNTKLVLQTDAELCLSSDTNAVTLDITEHVIQYGGRAWLHYFLLPDLKFTCAFGVWNNPEVREAGQYHYLEFRSSVQLIYFLTARRATTTFKAVAEQRFVENEERTKFEYKPRIRFSPKILYAINAQVIRQKTLYALITGEIYMTPAANPFFKITRMQGGFGYQFTDDVGLELTFTRQTIYNTEAPNAITRTIAITFIVNNIFRMQQ
jgi:hypothetical protein